MNIFNAKNALDNKIETKRLTLKALSKNDTQAIYEIAKTKAVAYTTAAIPHPCTLQDAQAIVKEATYSIFQSKRLSYGLFLRDRNTLIGIIIIMLTSINNQVEMGYWIGTDFWNKGYGTEAAKAMLKYAFKELQFERVSAYHLSRNIASGKILKNIGMRFDSKQLEGQRKWGVYEDIDYYTITRNEYIKLYN